jgi:hypothetical protein
MLLGSGGTGKSPLIIECECGCLQFLEDMDKMGQKAKYEKTTMNEIKQRVAQLSKLDVEIKKYHNGDAQ